MFGHRRNKSLRAIVPEEIHETTIVPFVPFVEAGKSHKKSSVLFNNFSRASASVPSTAKPRIAKRIKTAVVIDDSPQGSFRKLGIVRKLRNWFTRRNNKVHISDSPNEPVRMEYKHKAGSKNRKTIKKRKTTKRK
jgi:hypothetical protein